MVTAGKLSQRAAAIGLLALCYYGSGKLSFSIAVSHSIVTLVVFAPEGFSLAAALLLGTWAWPGVFLGQLVLAGTSGLSWPLAVGVSIANSAELVLAAYLFRRLGLRSDLRGPRDLAGLLLLAALVLQPFSATVGNLLLSAGGVLSPQDFGKGWFSWWLGNFMGQLLVAPCLLSCSQAGSRRRGWELLAVLAVVVPLSWQAFLGGHSGSVAAAFAVFIPLIVFLAVQRGLPAVTLATLAISLLALYSTALDQGPFVRDGHDQLLDLNIFLLGLTLTGQFLAVLLAERTRKHQELEAATVRAEMANRAKSEFLANVSHELRTPLNGVIGMAELLLEDELSQPQQERAQVIRSSANSLLAIIDDILDLSKIEAGKLELVEEDFPLGALLDGLVKALSPRARARSLALSWHLGPDLDRWYRGDPGRLRQVLTNLAGNAIKFTERGSVEIRGEDAGERGLRFVVKDTGIGLSEREQSQLFERFVQADRGTTRRYGGTGLGLAISKKLVGLMGGEIGLESQPGQGSTFWFTLPLLPGAPSAPTETSGGLEQFAARVLVVDDNKVNLLVARGMLERFGLEVDVASGGLQALEQLALSPYRLIFMDCQMPALDGYETTRRLRTSEILNAQTPVVALTASAMQGDREACTAAGMLDFVDKPLTLSKLSPVLSRWLGAAQGGE